MNRLVTVITAFSKSIRHSVPVSCRPMVKGRRQAVSRNKTQTRTEPQNMPIIDGLASGFQNLARPQQAFTCGFKVPFIILGPLNQLLFIFFGLNDTTTNVIAVLVCSVSLMLDQILQPEPYSS